MRLPTFDAHPCGSVLPSILRFGDVLTCLKITHGGWWTQLSPNRVLSLPPDHGGNDTGHFMGIDNVPHTAPGFCCQVLCCPQHPCQVDIPIFCEEDRGSKGSLRDLPEVWLLVSHTLQESDPQPLMPESMFFPFTSCTLAVKTSEKCRVVSLPLVEGYSSA